MFNYNNIIVILCSLYLVGCDAMQSTDHQKIEARTMIIGGVPVHDRDYQLRDHHEASNAVQVQQTP